MSNAVAITSADAPVWSASVTEKGAALLAKLTEGSILEIMEAQTGTGTVGSELLAVQTSVSSPKQVAEIQPVAYPEEKKCKLPVTIRNKGLTESYMATQIGVFANDPDEGKILFFLAEGAGVNIFSETLNPGYSADFEFYVGFGNASGVSVNVDPSNSVTYEGMENYVAAQFAELVPDSEKHVAYAQRAGEADRTKSSITIRVNGGRTEGTDMWTFNGSVSKSVNITPDKIGAAEKSHTHDVVGLGGISMKLLWENSDKTSEFGECSIATDLLLYDAYVVIARYSTTVFPTVSAFCKTGYSTRLTANGRENIVEHLDRPVVFRTETGQLDFSHATKDGSQDDKYLIPLFVYGIKGVL